MFLIFNVDDMFDGMAGLALLAIKLGILVAIITPPLSFLSEGEGVAISILFLAFIIAALLINILTIVTAIKKLSKDKKEKKTWEYTNYYAKNLKKHCYIVIISMLILSIIGFIIPIPLNFINLRISNTISMILLPFIFNIIFSLLLNGRLDSNKKVPKNFYIDEIKEYIIETLIKKVVRITFILFFIYSLIWLLIHGTIFYEKLDIVANIVVSQIQYYDSQYEQNRSDNFDIISTVEEQMSYIKNVLSKDDTEIDKIAKHHVGTARYAFEDELTFVVSYLSSDQMEELFNKKYGLSISIYSVLDKTEYEDKIWILKVYDRMYEKSYYYKFDIEQFKILEKLDNQIETDIMIQNYKIEFKEKQQL